MQSISMNPVAIVHSSRSEAKDDDWDGEKSHIEIDSKQFSAEALAGIFAQRAKNRPNQIGATICRIKKIEGRSLYIEGLDAIDGTPVLDIKPWVAEFAPRGSVFQPKWISELMTEYW